MGWVARVLGALLIAFGLVGVFAAWVGQGQGFAVPLWDDQAWSGSARRLADWATYALLALGGLALVLRQGAALWLLGLALAIALARTGYDVALGDPETARHGTMLQGDFVAIGVAVAALVAAVLTRRPVAAAV